MTRKPLVITVVLGVLRSTARLLPDGALASRWLALPGFIGFHRRLPRRLDHPQAMYRDFLYSKMLTRWTAQHRACVDKLEAKRVAAMLCPELRVARTYAVMDLQPHTSADDLAAFLQPHLGQPLVAKPTHTSGITVFLDRLQPGDVARLLQSAQRDYYLQAGESQYRGLPRRIIIEESLADTVGCPPPDWRFACTRGIPWFGMADFFEDGRLQEHYFSVPEFSLIDAQRHGAETAEPSLREPAQLRAMLEIASQLSAPFEFVRIDLYLARGEIWFGEFTFTPLAARERFSDPALSRWLCERAMRPEARVPLPEHLRIGNMHLQRTETAELAA